MYKITLLPIWLCSRNVLIMVLKTLQHAYKSRAYILSTAFLLSAFALLTISTAKAEQDERGRFIDHTESHASQKRQRCPNIQIVDELSQLNEFRTEKRQRRNELVSSVTLIHTGTSCTYEKGYIAVDIELEFHSHLGPRGKTYREDQPFFAYPFFVAVSDNDGHMLAKEIFAASVTYERDASAHVYYENLRQLIPIQRKKDVYKYDILLGFQLSQAQLEYNRANMMRKAPAPQPRPKPLSPEQIQAAKTPAPALADLKATRLNANDIKSRAATPPKPQFVDLPRTQPVQAFTTRAAPTQKPQDLKKPPFMDPVIEPAPQPTNKPQKNNNKTSIVIDE